jgi:hypothetical protein
MLLQAYLSKAMIEPGADVPSLVLDAVRRTNVGVASLTAGPADRFSCAAIKPLDGRLSLICAGEEPARFVAELVATMETIAGFTVYGFIKPGRILRKAVLGLSLSDDWWPIDLFDPRTQPEGAFEGDFMPDVFPAQLLNGNHLQRVGSVPAGFESRRLNHERTIILDSDQDRWLTAMRLPGHHQEPAIPAFIAGLRRDFAPALLRQSSMESPHPD